MKAAVVAFANQKGGVAKTTSTLHTAGCLTDKGYRVLVVDADPQGSATKYACPEFKTSHADMYDVVCKNATINEAIEINTSVGDILPASSSLNDTSVIDVNPYILKEVLGDVKEKYDFILIDTPPNLGMMLIASLLATEYVVIPTKATSLSVQGVGDLVDTIVEYSEYNPNLKIAGFLITMSNQRVLAVKKVIKDLKEYAESIDSKVFKNKIRTAEGLFGEAEVFGDNIFVQQKKHAAVKDYDGFVSELMEIVK